VNLRKGICVQRREGNVEGVERIHGSDEKYEEEWCVCLETYCSV